jgi:hypothetical protein
VHKKSSLLRKCGGDDNFIMKLSYIFPNNYIFWNLFVWHM